MADPAVKTADKTDKLTAIAILNNEERMHVLGLPGKKELGGTIAPADPIKLIPGWNFVDAALWSKARENKVCVAMLEEEIQPSKAPELNQECVGKVKLVEGPRVDPKDPLLSLEEDKAIRMVADLLDVEQLKTCLAKDKRDKVRDALRAKIEKIEGAGKKK